MKDTKYYVPVSDSDTSDPTRWSPVKTDNGRTTIRIASILLVLISLAATNRSTAQTIDNDARSPHAIGNNSKQQQKAEKKKAKQKEELNKAIKIGKKRHMSYQEKAVRRRMKKNMKKAKKWNDR